MAKANDRHHVVPRVRCRELGIAPNFNGNIRSVSVAKHRAWHTLFQAQTPEEAIETIRREWTLDEAGRKEFDRLRRNVHLIRRKT